MQLRAIMPLSLVALTEASCFAQAVPPSKPDPLVVAHEFLRTFYPDLRDKGYVLRVEARSPFDALETPAKSLTLEITTPGSNAVQVIGGCLSEPPPPKLPNPPELAQPQPKPTQEPSPDCKPRVTGLPTRVLFSRFWFRNDGSLRDFDAEGPFYEQIPSYKAFIEFQHAHPDVTNAEAMAELQKTAAKYPPQKKETFVRDLTMADLQRFLGKLRILSVEFSPPFDGDRFADTAEWTVHAECERHNGPRIRYEMHFEPYRGHLTWLRTTSPAER